MKFISFYTENYTQDAQLLKKSLENYGIDSSGIEYRESVGSWETNTQMKAEFILEKLKENDSVVWTDADSYLVQNPSFFDTITTDVGVFFLPAELANGFVPEEHSILKNVDKYLQSGTMYFKNNDKVIKLLETWIEINKRDSRQWDQWTLQVALENSDVTITQLPPEYISVWFVDKVYPNRQPVILHTEGRQRNEETIRNTIKTYKDLKGRVWKQPGIPKWIFRFGNESVENLHPKVIEIYEKQLKENPEYELFYFDTKDKLQFAQDFGDPRVEATYNKLVPPAFKCDFLKFVLLYTYGGVYMDYSMEPLIPLKDLFKGYKRILARDSPAPDGMCIGFITSEKGDELMREAMEKCIYNTNHNLYGVHILDITGPLMFSRVYKKLNQVNQIPIGIVSSDLYFYDMADALNIYDNGVPVIRLRMENHHKVLYNHQYDEDSPDNLHYHILYPKGKVFSRKINTYKDLKGKVWQEDGIPKWIFKTGPFEVNDLPEVYKHIFLDMLDKNPSYELFYFSDADCEQFIKDNYDEKYIKAYDTLIPTAYKADLWRTLLLYKYGGCYGDFSQAMLVSFDTIIEGMDRVLVLDTPASTNSLYNAFMCTKSGDDVLQRTIDYIMDNIDRRYYGIDTLDVTGPRVLGRAYCQVVYKNSRFSIPVAKRNKTNILNNPHESNMFIVDSNGTPMILKKLNNHWNIVYNDRGVKHYGELWHAGKVFK